MIDIISFVPYLFKRLENRLCLEATRNVIVKPPRRFPMMKCVDRLVKTVTHARRPNHVAGSLNGSAWNFAVNSSLDGTL